MSKRIAKDTLEFTQDDVAFLAHLIDCALHGRAPEPLPAGADWARVYHLAVENSVESLAGLGALAAPGVPARLGEAWREQVNVTLYRRLQFDAEREAVFAALAREGVSYLPLKGALLAGYYPRPEMRSMADNDFLYGFVEPLSCNDADAGTLGAGAGKKGYRIAGATERERTENVERGTKVMVRVMEGLGYRTISKHTGSHETFEKSPCFTFEPHRRLVSPKSPMAGYYANPWARAVRDGHDPYLYRFGASDEYVYVLAHAFKHFDVSGCGVRYVVDVRVFLDARGTELDWPYINEQLRELGLVEFERASRALADAAFGGQSRADGKNLGPEERGFLAHLVGSGTYGSFEQYVEGLFDKEVARHGGNVRAARRAYLWRRINDREAVEGVFPRATRLGVPYPVLMVARVLVRGAKSVGKMGVELRQLRKTR